MSKEVGKVPDSTKLTNQRRGIHQASGRTGLIMDGSDGRTWASFDRGNHSLGWWPFPKKDWINAD